MKHQATRLIAIVITVLSVFTVLSPFASCSELHEIDASVYELKHPGYDEYNYTEKKAANRTESNYSVKHYSDEGELQWTVTLSATFRYDHKTSECVSASISASSYNGWFVLEKSASYSGKTATGSATLKKFLLKVPMRKYVDLTMTCDKDGNVTRY